VIHALLNKINTNSIPLSQRRRTADFQESASNASSLEANPNGLSREEMQRMSYAKVIGVLPAPENPPQDPSIRS
jgi:hypothetical protein